MLPIRSELDPVGPVFGVYKTIGYGSVFLSDLYPVFFGFSERLYLDPIFFHRRLDPDPVNFNPVRSRDVRRLLNDQGTFGTLSIRMF